MYIDEDSIRIIIAQIIEALMYLHNKGIIYGDLKAENILIGNNGTIKLCDFNMSGTASLLNGSLQGTLSYISPEMIRRNKRTHKSDFWSLGVLCHLLFYRRYPFKDGSNTDLMKHIVNRNMIAEPRDRRASKQLRLLIEELLNVDYKKRLGNRIEDFKQHPFFEGFDWYNYFGNKSNFKYAKNYAPSEEDTSNVSHDPMDSQNTSRSFNDSSNYKIEGFTYQQSMPSMVFFIIIIIIIIIIIMLVSFYIICVESV